ncbi:MAG: PD40 domain-containing protein [Chloroflexi bacterium]|nr:PD40 domain-containing protein [Chloroflexota bacterium]
MGARIGLTIALACVLAGCAAPPPPTPIARTEAPFTLPGGRVLYSNAGTDLWTSAPDKTDRRQLTRDGAASGDGYAGGRWSPDGKLVAAERVMAKENGSALWLVSVPDGSAVRLTRPDTFLDGFAWSPDGRSLAYGELTSGGTLAAGGSLVGGVGDVKLYEIATKTTTVVGPGTHPTFSPDGKQLGWAHSSGAIAAYDLKTATTTFLVNLADLTRYSTANAPRGMGLLGGPVWSADSQRIAYAAIERGPILEALQIVYVQDAKPLAPPKQWAIGKTGAVHHVADLRWAPTGSTLAYAIINAQPHHHWIGTIDPAKGELSPLFDSVRHFLDFTWSPDGSLLLLQLDDDDAWAFIDPRKPGVAKRLEPGGWRPDWCRCAT